MGILEILFSLVILIYPFGEIGRLQFSDFAVSVNDIAILIFSSVWIVKKIKGKKKTIKGELMKPILVFFSIGGVALLLNINYLNGNAFTISFLYLIRWLLYSTIYFSIFDLDSKFRKKIPYLLLFSSTFLLAIGFIQFIFYQNLRNLYYLGWDEHLYRLFSSFLDPNFAGAFFVLSLILVLGVLVNSYKKINSFVSILLSLLAVFNLFAIYLTYSRSALVMLTIGLFSFFILVGRKRWIFFLSLILIAIIFLVPKSFETEGTNLLRTASNEARLKSAGNALSIVKDNLVFGVGFNAYRYAQLRYGFIEGRDWEITHSGAGTDNSFLFVLATTGIVGLTSFLYLLYKVFKLGVGRAKKNIYSVILISSLLGLIVNSFFINSLFYVFIIEWIWIIAGLTENS